MKKSIRVKGAAALKEGKTLKFPVAEGRFRGEAFLLRAGGELRAYRNRCPHAGMPLDFGDNEFYTDDGKLLVCRSHGALFDPKSGLCVDGPCAGETLERFSAVPRGNDVSVSALTEGKT